MYSKELEAVIDAALADGVLTDKERAVLHKPLKGTAKPDDGQLYFDFNFD